MPGQVFDWGTCPKEPAGPCDLCGREGNRSHSERDRYGYEVRVVRCRGCGLVYFDPRMTAAAARVFYGGPYRRLVSAWRGYEVTPDSMREEQERYAAALLPILEPHLTPSHYLLLDVGGSTGVVAHAMAKRFILDAVVLDPCPTELAVAEKRYGLVTKLGTLDDAEFEVQAFDVVTVCQSLDHVLRPAWVLRRCRELLGPGGVFFADVVDYGTTRTLKLDHPFNFTPQTAKEYLRRAGYQVLSETRFWDGNHVGYVCH